MPLAETEWDLVTLWAREYLLDTTDPHSRLVMCGFPAEFVAALRLTAVASENARALVAASRKDIDRQLRLVEVLVAEDRLAVLPETVKAEEFRSRLREDRRAHLSRDNFQTRVLKNGAEVFIDRRRLRETLRRFVDDPEKSVLLVDGEPGSGRSYTYSLIRHIGQHHGFRPARVTLCRASTAEQVVRRLADFVADPRAGAAPLNPTELNDLLPSIDDAVHWVVGRATAMDERLWLVLDECDRLDPGSDVWDFIGQLALAIYEHTAVRGPEAPRLVLLGYGSEMRQLPYDLRGSLLRDTAEVAGPDDLRAFFDGYFHESPPSFLDPGRPEEDTLAALVDAAVEEVLRAVGTPDGGEGYMRRLCSATEGAVRVYRTL
ncbi:DEAD/DEAH box helicase family protein [Streptomyces sp. NPDC014894]|uniref:DEAD/DEAH box helicase family protein n=1 Tax=Streptomyces sp. NPDC014894 TaxID=3364931 RepID=UPI0036FF4C7D